jgi:hypothetical protein
MNKTTIGDELPDVTTNQVYAYKCIMHASQAKYIRKNKNKEREELAVAMIKAFNTPDVLKPLVSMYKTKFSDSNYLNRR